MTADRRLMRQIAGILDSGNTSPFFKNFNGGPYVQAFEKEFARYVGVRYAVSMANGTLALNAIYSVLDRLKEGQDEIIVSPLTFVATISEIVRAGCKPVFADVQQDTMAIDCFEVIAKINPRTAAVVVMHPLGVPVDMNDFTRLTVPIVEDACQALGSTYDDKMCGSFGLMSAFSLQQTKSLQVGEGSVCVTNEREMYDRLCFMRNHGNKYAPFKEKYAHLIATNYRLTEIQAAVALHALKGYAQVLAEQRKRAQILLDTNQESFHFQAWSGNSNPNRYIVGLFANSPQARAKFLQRTKRFNRGIPGYVVGSGYSELVYDLPAFRKWKTRCPNAEQCLGRSVWIDCRRMPIEVVKELGREIERFK